MNPCKCGWKDHPRRGCRCTAIELAHYAARVSGPVLDRLDLQIEVPSLTSGELLAATDTEPSIAVRERVLAGEERVSALHLAEALQFRAYEARVVGAG